MSDATSQPRIPASLLYWGSLSPAAKSGSPEGQDYRFERVLPVPVDHLHTTRAALPDGGLVVVGIEPERLRTHLAARTDVTPHTWELVPDQLPEHIGQTLGPTAATSVLAQLNLLHTTFEPEPRRRLRRRIALVLNAALVLAVVILLVGIERRAGRLQQQAEQFTTTTRALITDTVTLTSTDRHPELRLTMELRRLEQAALGSTTDGPDPVAALSALWRAWPADLRTQVEAVAALQDRLVIRGNVPTLADAERIAQACRTLDPALNLRLQPLQAQANERGAGFLLTLVHQKSGTP